MRLNLSIAAMALCAALTGCGPSQEVTDLKKVIADIERNLENRRTELQAATTLVASQTSECATSRTEGTTRIAELKDTILSIMDGVEVSDSDGSGAAGHSWTIAVQDLSPESWSWREEELGLVTDWNGDGRAAQENLSYSVDPRLLSPKVKVGEFRGYPAVQIVCEGGANCISVRGRRLEGVKSGGSRDTSNSEVSEKRASNWWAVSSPADSGRLAVATGELITTQRSLVSPACQSADEGKNKVSALETEIANLDKTLAEKQRDLRAAEN